MRPAALCALFLLAACGYKGPLYLPPPEKPPSAQPIPAPDRPPDEKKKQ